MLARLNPLYVLVAALAVLAVFSVAGHPLVSPEALAGLGAMPMVMGHTMDDVHALLTQQGTVIDQFKARQDARLGALERDFRTLEAKAGRPHVFGGDDRLTAEQAEHRKAFDKYLRRGDDAGLMDIQRKAMNSGSDPDAGYLVLPEMDNIIGRVAPTISAMYRVANVVTVGSNKYEKLVKKTGMAMRRVAEGATGGETTEPTYAKIAIEVHPSEVEPWVHNETLEDAFVNLEADLAGEAGIAFAEGAGAEFIDGNGVGKARGITSYTNVANASYEWGKIGYVVSGASGAFKTTSATVNPGDALVDLVHALKAQYRTGAVWMMNSNTAGVVRKLKDNDGRWVWQDSMVQGQPPTLLGYPVEIDDNFDDIGAGTYSIAFGNFKRGYTIANRNGTVLIRDPFTSKGVTKFNFRRRFGGGVTNFEAIKLLRFATS